MVLKEFRIGEGPLTEFLEVPKGDLVTHFPSWEELVNKFFGAFLSPRRGEFPTFGGGLDGEGSERPAPGETAASTVPNGISAQHNGIFSEAQDERLEWVQVWLTSKEIVSKVAAELVEKDPDAAARYAKISDRLSLAANAASVIHAVDEIAEVNQGEMNTEDKVLKTADIVIETAAGMIPGGDLLLDVFRVQLIYLRSGGDLKSSNSIYY